MFGLVLRTLFGVLVAWVLLGALIGITAALWKRVTVPGGVFLGAVFGPFALLMFLLPADSVSKHGGYKESHYTGRCCPVCPDPNDLLIWQGFGLGRPRFGDFVAPLPTYMHRYQCRVCGYEFQFESLSMNPDTPPGPKYV